MTVYAITSKLKEMKTYDKEKRDVSSGFKQFASNTAISDKDKSIISYVLEIEQVPINSPLELRMIQRYYKQLLLADKFKLKNVNMDVWAYYNLLSQQNRKAYL